MVNQMFRLLSVISIFILTTVIATPSYSDDVIINLDSTTPYVDIPVTVTEPVDATVSTTTGTPKDNPTFIDSWIEVWQDTVRLAYNDDGLHSDSNVLASIINIPLQVGEYFIRATSYAYICCAQLPTGSYLLSTNLTVSTPSPSPTVTESTPEPSPSLTESLTPSPTPVPSSSQTTDEPTPEPSSPSPSPSDIPSPLITPEVPVVPVQEPSEPSPEVLLESSTPVPSPTPSVQDTLEEVVDSSFNDFPSSLENELPSLDELLLQEDVSSSNEVESLLQSLGISLPPVLSEAVQQVFETISSALSTVSNLGSDLSEENREEAQQVVLAVIILPQLAMAAIGRNK
jgi:hypothetical protein